MSEITTGKRKKEIDTAPFNEMLNVQLKEDELIARGAALAKAEITVRELREKKKDASKEWNGKIDAVEVELKTLARIVDTRLEERPVEVAWRPNYTTKRAELVRADSLAIVRERDLTVDELQLEFDVMDGGKQEELAPVMADLDGTGDEVEDEGKVVGMDGKKKGGDAA